MSTQMMPQQTMQQQAMQIPLAQVASLIPKSEMSKSQSQNILYLIVFLNIVIILYMMGSTFYSLIKDDEI